MHLHLISARMATTNVASTFIRGSNKTPYQRQSHRNLIGRWTTVSTASVPLILQFMRFLQTITVAKDLLIGYNLVTKTNGTIKLVTLRQSGHSVRLTKATTKKTVTSKSQGPLT